MLHVSCVFACVPSTYVLMVVMFSGRNRTFQLSLSENNFIGALKKKLNLPKHRKFGRNVFPSVRLGLP